MQSAGDSIAARFRYTPGTAIFDYPTRVDLFDDPKRHLQGLVGEISDLQERFYAQSRTSLLMVFQGMDASGKDSTIKHVTSGVNPQGFQVFNFRQPTYKEIDHNYLWRYWQAMPERGRIGIFNRSHYEEVLVVRVHPDILHARRLPQQDFDERFWRNRFQDIRSLERHLDENGTKVVKFFLNLSKDEQKRRLWKRLQNPNKLWKFDPRDINERQHWNDYQLAYQEAVTATHTDAAPWYLIPADHKWTMRAIVASIVATELGLLEPSYPEPTGKQVAQINWAREQLAAEESP
ncbi:MAG: polyphosphate kinase 2 family protein [Gammaproteobacteria bacterium]|nr:polyphosphate kinase 2 family protein [Gammaproteobacteria bacterium]